MRKDKILHAGVCCAIAFIVAVLLALVADVWLAVTVGVVSSILLGIGKEYGDKNAAGNHWCYGCNLNKIIATKEDKINIRRII